MLDENGVLFNRVYCYLMDSEESIKFVEEQQDVKTIKLGYVYTEKYIECALWPLLYLKKEWCESAIEDSGTRKSAKICFRLNLLSNIVNFSADFGLLQYNFDRWIFRIISGAVTVGKNYDLNPAKSLENKWFVSSYWKIQHEYLIDAVNQFGYPSMFITISPYEWTFPQVKELLEV